MVTMNISLTPEMAKIVNFRVESGLYGSTSEYLSDAIRIAENLALRQAVESGVEQADKGIFAEYDYSSLMKELDNEI
jgi:putative addiction module CopG family antidote